MRQRVKLEQADSKAGVDTRSFNRRRLHRRWLEGVQEFCFFIVKMDVDWIKKHIVDAKCMGGGERSDWMSGELGGFCGS
jgi:superfamily I DNA and RNA helicase